MNLANYLISAGVIISLGLVFNFALPPAIDLYINSQIALTPGSQSYPLWREVPVPIYQKFYFFNVTNVHEIETFGHKPQLEEIGPFTYRSEFTKRDIEQDDVLATINFKHIKHWHFEPSMSIADESLQLVTLNAPLAITLSLIQSASNAVRLLVTFSLDGLSEGFFTKRSVEQLLFAGYPDLLTTFGPLLNAEMLSQGGHFGYMNARNNSIDGMYEINSGLDDIAKLNTINKFNGRTELPYWSKHGECNSLKGATTGEMYPPLRDEQQSVKLFQPDFCRVWRMDYESKYEHATGLRLKRFVATRDVFRNSTDLPENSCYFPHHHHKTNNKHKLHAEPLVRNQVTAAAPTNRLSRGSSNNNSNKQQHDSNKHNRVRHEWPAGVFTLAPCKFHAPIYISMPHFLDADPYYHAQVGGLSPDQDRHEFYVDVEPRTGSPVQMSARVQLNVAISKPPGLVRFRNVPEIMFPVFWQELSVNVTGPAIDQLLLASRHVNELTTGVSCVLLVLGSTILITTALFHLHRKLRLGNLWQKPAADTQQQPTK